MGRTDRLSEGLQAVSGLLCSVLLAAESLLTPLQKAYLDLPREKRTALFADSSYRKRLAEGKWHPRGVEVFWSETEGSGDYVLSVRRRSDGTVVWKSSTAVPSAVVDNLEIATGYSWDVFRSGRKVADGRFDTSEDAPRLLRIDGLYNTRDIGGRIGLNGRRIRQGMIIRSGAFNANAETVWSTREEVLAGDHDGSLRREAERLENEIAWWRKRETDGGKLPMIAIEVGPVWDVVTVGESGSRKIETNDRGSYAFPFDTTEEMRLTAEFEASGDGLAVIGASGDWFWSLELNGTIVADYRDGNEGDAGDAATHPIPVRVKKGTNRLVARIRPGTAGCVWSCRALPMSDDKAVVSAAIREQGRILGRLFKVAKGKRPGKAFVTEEGRRWLLESVGLKTELDLRSDDECWGMTGSPLGSAVRRVQVPMVAYTGMRTKRGREAFARAFRVFLDSSNYPLDFHCIAGQDRTGCLSFILLGLLGAEEDELYKDWEATGFWSRKTSFCHANWIDPFVGVLNAYPGASLNERICAYVRGCGISEAEIARFRELMLEPSAPDGLTVERRKDPVGIDSQKPRLGWRLPSGVRRQTAYEIESDGWSSGKVVSDRQTDVSWGGRELETSQRVTWRVRVWDENDAVSAWSAPSTFVCGVMRPSDWRARWIGPSEDSYAPVDMANARWIVSDVTNAFCRAFLLASAPTGVCELAFAATGEYDLRLNGVPVAQTYFEHFHEWKLLRTIDVGAQLKEGTNELVAVIRQDAGRRPAFIARLDLPGPDVLTTGADWGDVRELGGLREIEDGAKIVARYEIKPPAFLRAFAVSGSVARATLHATGLGFYEASLNGVRIGDKVLDPSPTDYDKRVLYSTYVLDGMLREGTNELKLVLGHGWYDVRSIASWNYDTAPWRDLPRAIAQLEIQYADGRHENVVTDETWRQVGSPVAYDCIREGEISRGEAPKSSGQPVAVRAPRGRLVASGLPGARKLRRLKPTSIRRIGEGAWSVSFAENIAGWVRLRMRGLKPGDVVSLTYDERLAPNGGPAQVFDWHQEQSIWASRPGVCYRDIDRYLVEGQSYRVLPGPGVHQRDRYIASGCGVEAYEPRFMYHGFQHVIVRGLAEQLTADDIAAYVVGTDFADIGSFRCSHETFNRMMTAASRSYRANFADGFPTDCPHREKNGWMGDAAVASTLAQFMFENTAGYEKWLGDIVDSQRASGELPGIAPTSGWGFKWGNGPVWDMALPLVAWNLWTYRADRRALDSAYPALVKYLSFMRREKERQELVDWGLDDWVPARDSAKPSREYTVSCYYLKALEIAADMARVKGLDNASEDFAVRAGGVRTALRTKFGRGNGIWDNGGETAQALALEFGLCSGEEEQRATESRLVQAFREADDHVTMGLVGMTHAFRALSKAGRTDLAFRVLTQPTRPSPAAWILGGATTLHESWDSDTSLNHVMFADFAAWAYQHLAGIRPVAPGFKAILLAPEPIDDLDFAEAETECPYGTIRSSWTRSGKAIRYSFVVPPGTSARICVPGRPAENVGPGRHDFEVVAKRQERRER